MTTNLDVLLEQFRDKHGVFVDLCKGAAILETSTNDQIWLEAPDSSPLVLLHLSVLGRISVKSNLHTIESILKKNSNSVAMKGAWFCIHEQTDTLRLCMNIPKKYADLELLDRCIENITNLSKQIENIA